MRLLNSSHVETYISLSWIISSNHSKGLIAFEFLWVYFLFLSLGFIFLSPVYFCFCIACFITVNYIYYILITERKSDELGSGVSWNATEIVCGPNICTGRKYIFKNVLRESRTLKKVGNWGWKSRFLKL